MASKYLNEDGLAYYDGKIKSLIEEKANQTDVYGSEEYSATTSYSVDDMCIYDGKLWKCLVACSGQIPSESTYWTNISLKSFNSNLNTQAIPSALGNTVGGAISVLNEKMWKKVYSVNNNSSITIDDLIINKTYFLIFKYAYTGSNVFILSPYYYGNDGNGYVSVTKLLEGYNPFTVESVNKSTIKVSCSGIGTTVKFSLISFN